MSQQYICIDPQTTAPKGSQFLRMAAGATAVATLFFAGMYIGQETAMYVATPKIATGSHTSSVMWATEGKPLSSARADLSLDATVADAPLSLDTLSSRVDRPIAIPTGVKISRKDGVLTVQGPKGTLSRPIPDEVHLREENSILLVTYVSEERKSKAMFGLYRALINNMVVGVSQEFVKRMEMIGVGYRARVDGKNLVLAVGKSHDVVMPIPEGLKVVVEDNIRLVVSGISNEAVGQFCANVRKERPPEPYKGKGIRYLGEKIIMKVGKGGKGKK